MFYKCCGCGHIFEEGEEKYIGNGWDEPRESCCPVCGDLYEQTEVCQKCAGHFFEDDLTDGFCEDCVSEIISEYSFNHITELYLMASNEKEEVELNPFIASMFSPSQINELLLRELVNNNKLRNVDCSSFIESDLSWFLGKIPQKKRG